MIDIFGNTPIRLDRLVCHSGGAKGSSLTINFSNFALQNFTNSHK
jgi:hypothetical protein